MQEESLFHRIPTWGGLGLGLISFFAPYVWKTMPEYLAWSGVIAGVMLVLYGVWPMVGSLPKLWNGTPWGLVPLPDAARLAYEAIQGRAYGQFAEGFEQKPGDIVSWLANAILGYRPSLYGRRLPSSKVTKISMADPHLSEDAGSIVGNHGNVTHTDLAIRKSDLRAIIKQLRRADRFFPKQKN